MKKEEILNFLVKKKIIKKNSEDDYSFIDTASKVKAKCKNLPDYYRGLSAKQALETFFKDCEIPHIIKNKDFEYAVRTTTKKSENIFMKILTDESIDFNILVARTKSWYNNPKSARSKTSSYFESGQWKQIYEFNESSGNQNKNFWR